MPLPRYGRRVRAGEVGAGKSISSIHPHYPRCRGGRYLIAVTATSGMQSTPDGPQGANPRLWPQGVICRLRGGPGRPASDLFTALVQPPLTCLFCVRGLLAVPRGTIGVQRS